MLLYLYVSEFICNIGVCSACAITCVFTLLAVSHIQGDTVSFGGFSLREEAKTLIPGSLFQ